MSARPILPQLTFNASVILTKINNGQILILDHHRVGGLILCKRYHAELAGPGSAIGGVFDMNCIQAIPIGDLVLTSPISDEDRQQGYATRQIWIRYMQQIMKDPISIRRAQGILILLQKYFQDEPTLSDLPDHILAMLVGVLPQTIRTVRQATQSPES